MAGQTYTYKFTGETSETFPYLPSDPPSVVLGPGDLVVCSQKVIHDRLELQGAPVTKAKKTPEATGKAGAAAPGALKAAAEGAMTTPAATNPPAADAATTEA